MWPTLLNMTRDDCRRTLRRLELEAYSNMISVFRAQGALEDNRKKLLEELRAVLHIGNDRHSAEARRVANDEYLATIAEQLCGPNTGLGWTSEGRRKIPLMPRGIPQTAFTDIADQAALSASIENEHIIHKNNETEKNALVAPKSTPEEANQDVEMADMPATGDDGLTSDNPYEYYYAPVVMEDQSSKFLDAERDTPTRKRIRRESGKLAEDISTLSMPPARNTSRANNQKHLNISQIYSNYSKNPSGKTPAQSKHSYNQLNKSNNKVHVPRGSTKHRVHKNSSSKPPPQIVISKSQMKNSVNIMTESNVSFPSNVMQYQKDLSKATTPTSGFQANFAQSIKKSAKSFVNSYGEEMKISSPSVPMNVVSDSPQTQTAATTAQEYSLHEEPFMLHGSAKAAHTPLSAKPCHLIIKKKGEVPERASSSTKVSNIQFVQKPTEGIKVIHNRQMTVAGNTAPLNQTGKLLTTKIVQQVPTKVQKPSSANSLSQMDVNSHLLSFPNTIQKGVLNSKNIIISNANVTVPINKETHPNLDSAHLSKVSEDAGTAKNIVTDVKPLSTKTFVLNSKSGQKMVVVPGKARTKTPILGQSLPLLQVKGIAGRPQMKFVPMSNPPIVKSTSNITLVSKSNITNTLPNSAPKILGVDAIRPNLSTVSSYDSTKKIQISSTKMPGQAIIRPASTKGNVIVLQKGTSISKGALTFTKNANEVSKLMLPSKNVCQLNIHSPVTFKHETPEQIPTAEPEKGPGNVIVLELNNEKLGQGTTISDILEENAMNTFVQNNTTTEKSKDTITEDTPILFDNQLSDETSNANSMDSLSDTMMSSTTHTLDRKNVNDEKHNASSAADWEMVLDTREDKEKCDQNIDKGINSLQLDLGMSSDSETDAYLLKNEKCDSKQFNRELSDQQDIDGRLHVQQNELYAGRGGLTHPTHTLLSQLQDEGSLSNDSPFLITKTINRKLSLPQSNVKVGANTDGLAKDIISKSTVSHDLDPDKTKMSEERVEVKVNQKQTDIFSSAIASADINLDTFEYLEDGMMSADEMFQLSGEDRSNKTVSQDRQLSQLLQGNRSSDVRENMTLTK